MRVEMRMYDAYTKYKGKIVPIHAIKHTGGVMMNLDTSWR